MSKRSYSRPLVLLALAAALCAAPAIAQDVIRGVDLWGSQDGTAVVVTLPAGFFPGCNLPFNGAIDMGGVKIRANKDLGDTDTIIARVGDVPGGTGSTDLFPVALCLKNTCWRDPCGKRWTVAVNLDDSQGPQPLGQIDITRTSGTGGVFDASLFVRGSVTWTDGTITLGPVIETVNLNTSMACWQYTPKATDVTVAAPYVIDRNCDGALDFTVPAPYGTSNFFACGPVNHDGPHPVKPARECTDFDIQPIDGREDADIQPIGDQCRKYRPACN